MSYGASAYSPVWESIIGYTRPQYIRPYAKRPNADELALSLRDELAEGLVLYLPFVRFVSHRPDTLTEVFDRSPYNNHGTINGAVWQTLPSGKSALSFDGANDYVEVPNDESICGEFSEITIAAWIKPIKEDAQIVDNRVSGEGGYVFRIDKYKKLYFELRDQGSNLYFVTSASVIPLDEFSFVSAAYKSPYMKIYINGNLDRSVDRGTFTVGSSSGNLYIGRAYWGIAKIFNGIIGELRIYSRALSKKKNKRLFNLTRVFYGV